MSTLKGEVAADGSGAGISTGDPTEPKVETHNGEDSVEPDLCEASTWVKRKRGKIMAV